MAKKIFIIAMILLILAAVMLCAMLVIRVLSCEGKVQDIPDTGTEGEYELLLKDYIIDDETVVEENSSGGNANESGESAVPPGVSEILMPTGIYAVV